MQVPKSTFSLGVQKNLRLITNPCTECANSIIALITFPDDITFNPSRRYKKHVFSREVSFYKYFSIYSRCIYISRSRCGSTYIYIDLYMYIYYIHIMESDNSTIFSTLAFLECVCSRTEHPSIDQV